MRDLQEKDYPKDTSYNSDLKSLLRDQKYVQWIDRRFISTQINPRDIDLVNLIDYKLVNTYEKELKQFINRLSKEKYGVDGYTIRIYPEGHENYIHTKSDLIY